MKDGTDEGYVKLWRKIDKSDCWSAGLLTRSVFVWLFLHASYKPRSVYGVELERGEIITSYAKIAQGVAWEENHVRIVPTVAAIRHSIKTLKKRGSLQQEPHQGGLRIKLLQYGKYQGDSEETATGAVTGTTTGLQQDCNTIQEGKKVRRVKNNHNVPPTGDAATIFTHWQQTMNHTGAEFSPNRKAAIERALKSLPVEKCLLAIDGCALTDWNMGRDPKSNGRRYNDLTLILRNAEHWEAFIETAQAGNNGKAPSRTFTPEEEAIITNSLALYDTDWQGAFDASQNDELWVEVMRRKKA
jgi:hypothetical protein